MSLLAGLKFVKKVPPSSLPPPAASEKGGGERDNEKRKSSSSSKKHHHKKDKKDKGRSSSSRKKSKDAIADANEPASKRQKSHKNSSASGASAAAASESGDVDWLDQAFNFGADGGKGGGDSDSLTPEEIAQRKREEDIDREVVEGKRDPNTKRTYGLYDPLKADLDEAAAPTSADGGGERGGGLSGRGGGLPSTFAPRLTTGVGDKGAGWRAKALKRARERAEKSGESLEDLVGERWGSLEKLKHDARGASAGGRGMGRGYGYRKGREELASLAAGEGRIDPHDTGGILGQVGRGGSGGSDGDRHRSSRDTDGDTRGGRGGRLRIGRDARDTDVLKRFSSKLEDALGRNDETRRSRKEQDGDAGVGAGRDDVDGDGNRRHHLEKQGGGGRGGGGYAEDGDAGRGRSGVRSDKTSGERSGDRSRRTREGEGGRSGGTDSRDRGDSDEGVSRERRRDRSYGKREEGKSAAAGPSGGIKGDGETGPGERNAGASDGGGWREREARVTSGARDRGDDHRYRESRDDRQRGRGEEHGRSRDSTRGGGSIGNSGDNGVRRGVGSAARREGGGERWRRRHDDRGDDGSGRRPGRGQASGDDDPADRRARGETDSGRDVDRRRSDGEGGGGSSLEQEGDGRRRRHEPEHDEGDGVPGDDSTRPERIRSGGNNAGAGNHPLRSLGSGGSAGDVRKAEAGVDGVAPGGVGASSRAEAGGTRAIRAMEGPEGAADGDSNSQGKKEGRGEDGGEGAVGKRLTDEEMTKLSVQAMKAKLKGDKATHARLMEEIKGGREANAAAAAVAEKQVSATVPPSVRWNPGQDSDNDSDKGTGDDTTGRVLLGKRRGEKGAGRDGARRRESSGGGVKDQKEQELGDDDEEADEVEVVTMYDDRGRPVKATTAPLMREDLKSGARKGKLKKVGGRWAEQGDESVADFVRREREQGFEDMDETFLRNVSRLGNKFRGTELGGAHTGLAGEDEEEEVDMRMFQRPEDRMTAQAAAERQKARAIAAHKRQSQATSRCHLCMDSPVFNKRLVLSLGEHTFLYLATGTRKLSEGHCYIVPIRHTPASTACDEDVWREIDLFKSCLRRMAATASSASVPPAALSSSSPLDVNAKQRQKNAKKGRQSGGGVIFLETGGKPGASTARHTFIEAVPVHKNAFLDAPMYFRQALLDAGDEWSTHKKCISADPRRGGVRRAVPKGFPYFHVEWEDGGYAHIIEGEEAKFPRDFGVDTLAGVLGVDPPSFGGRGRGRRGGVSSGGKGGAGDEEERKTVMAFLERWKPFDWTAELDGGEYQEETDTAASAP